jgi:flagellar hook-length control protein FliK
MLELSAVATATTTKLTTNPSSGSASDVFSSVLATADAYADSGADPGGSAIIPAASGDDADADRQKIAANGDDLPDSDGKTADAGIINLAWLATTLPIALPAATATAPVNASAAGAGNAVAAAALPNLSLPAAAAADSAANGAVPASSLSPIAGSNAPVDTADDATTADTAATDKIVGNAIKALQAGGGDTPDNAVATTLSAPLASTPVTPPSLATQTPPTPPVQPVATVILPAVAASAAGQAVVAASQANANQNTAPAPTPAAPRRATTVDRSIPSTNALKPADTSVADLPVIGLVQPAARAFASALAATTITPRQTGDDDDAVTGFTPNAMPGAVTTLAPHNATDGSTVVDTRDSKWLAGMLDHIEVLRDTADARDTRIRLVPDALGKVDVSITKSGDAVNVRFSAESPAARQMLTDAQPRLTALAEARGLRIGETSVDSGGSGSGPASNGGGTGNSNTSGSTAQQRQPDPSRTPIFNRPSSTADAADAESSANVDGWIA